MYIGAASLGPLLVSGPSPPLVTADVARLLLEPERNSGWFENVLRDSWAFILRVLDVIGTWYSRWGPFLTWMSQALSNAYSFIQHHPHPFHILSWAIFFGPIIILIPCLLLVEIAILLLFHLGVLFHGQTRESIPDRFEFLKDYFIDWRESLFATVEHWTATFNKWTVDYPALLVLRLLSGAMGLFVLIGIWSGW